MGPDSTVRLIRPYKVDYSFSRKKSILFRSLHIMVLRFGVGNILKKDNGGKRWSGGLGPKGSHLLRVTSLSRTIPRSIGGKERVTSNVRNVPVRVIPPLVTSFPIPKSTFTLTVYHLGLDGNPTRTLKESFSDESMGDRSSVSVSG